MGKPIGAKRATGQGLAAQHTSGCDRPTRSIPARAGNGAFYAVDTGLHVLAIEHTRRDELMVTTFNSTLEEEHQRSIEHD